jgi:hypothetical protein
MNYATLLKIPTFQGAMEELVVLIEDGREVFLEFEEMQLQEPIRAGKWSRKEIIGHLIDSALNNTQRFTRAQIVGHLEDGKLIAQG